MDGMLADFGPEYNRYIGVGTIPQPMTLPASGCKTPEKLSEVSQARAVRFFEGVDLLKEYQDAHKSPLTAAICEDQLKQCNADAGPWSNSSVRAHSACTNAFMQCMNNAGTKAAAPAPRTVTFNLLIDSDGTVCDVQLAQPGHTEDELDRSAIKHLKQALFFPAVKDGVPVAVWIRVPVVLP